MKFYKYKRLKNKINICLLIIWITTTLVFFYNETKKKKDNESFISKLNFKFNDIFYKFYIDEKKYTEWMKIIKGMIRYIENNDPQETIKVTNVFLSKVLIKNIGKNITKLRNILKNIFCSMYKAFKPKEPIIRSWKVRFWTPYNGFSKDVIKNKTLMFQ